VTPVFLAPDGSEILFMLPDTAEVLTADFKIKRPMGEGQGEEEVRLVKMPVEMVICGNQAHHKPSTLTIGLSTNQHD
jgi:hypothetical protein